MTRRLLLTGTDTGVGKTRVTAALLRALRARGLRVAGMKPIASGCVETAEGLRNDDALALIAAVGEPLSYETVNPFALPLPVSPHLAARAAGVTIDPARIVAAAEELARGRDLLLIEGAGGWLSPLAEGLDHADLARLLGCDVLLVVGLRLGCISHARLTLRAILADGLSCVGWIANAIDPELLLAAAVESELERFLAVPRLARLSFGAADLAEVRWELLFPERMPLPPR
ncbi:MAG: dethiobiotin synthase [Xanthomonadales bacterium]|nr:dethiobiotin synthase [Xanthomonadales bacterium]